MTSNILVIAQDRWNDVCDMTCQLIVDVGVRNDLRLGRVELSLDPKVTPHQSLRATIVRLQIMQLTDLSYSEAASAGMEDAATLRKTVRRGKPMMHGSTYVTVVQWEPGIFP